jgi:hypothetical protein
MQFKRQIAITLSVYYAICVIGLALSMHFCGGKLAAVTWGEKQASCKLCSGNKKIEKSNNCCKNTQLEVKVSDHHQLVDTYKLPKVFESPLIANLFSLNAELIPSVALLTNNLANSPPELKRSSVKIFIQNQVFRI